MDKQEQKEVNLLPIEMAILDILAEQGRLSEMGDYLKQLED